MTGKSVRDVERYQAVLAGLLAEDENKFCADCQAKVPSMHPAGSVDPGAVTSERELPPRGAAVAAQRFSCWNSCMGGRRIRMATLMEGDWCSLCLQKPQSGGAGTAQAWVRISGMRRELSLMQGNLARGMHVGCVLF